jgi:hypothetical protein
MIESGRGRDPQSTVDNGPFALKTRPGVNSAKVTLISGLSTLESIEYPQSEKALSVERRAMTLAAPV